jgi:pyruvate/2-oxoglutarate dehydrogenase complex dihydrolipoamide acyltransferase (E2) component
VTIATRRYGHSRASSQPNDSADPIGRYTIVVPSLDRQLAIDAFAAIPSGHPMVAAMELDVTAALSAIADLKRKGDRVSLFAFIVRSIAVAISEHPDLNLVRHGKRLVRFEDVDVSVPVEVHTDDGSVPREVVIRRAQQRTVQEIYAELERARTRHRKTGETSDEDRWARKLMRSVVWLPSFVRIGLMRFLIHDAFRVKARAGTTLVTSVGKFASVPGFQFTFSTGPRAAVFVVGSVVDKPWMHRGQIVPRSVLSLSVMVDHDLVDGAPAARFAHRVQELIESAEGLSESGEARLPVIEERGAADERSGSEQNGGRPSAG